VEMLDAAGRPIPTEVTDGPSYTVPVLPEKAVVITGGAEASFEVGYTDATGYEQQSVQLRQRWRSHLPMPAGDHRVMRIRPTAAARFRSCSAGRSPSPRFMREAVRRRLRACPAGHLVCTCRRWACRTRTNAVVAREGMATMRPRALATVILAIVIAASTGSESVRCGHHESPTCGEAAASPRPVGHTDGLGGRLLTAKYRCPCQPRFRFPIRTGSFLQPSWRTWELLIRPRGTTATVGLSSSSQSTLVRP